MQWCKHCFGLLGTFAQGNYRRRVKAFLVYLRRLQATIELRSAEPVALPEQIGRREDLRNITTVMKFPDAVNKAFEKS